jgi:hypothetical protein
MCSFVSAQTYIGLDKVEKIKLLESTREDVQKNFTNSKSEINGYNEWFDLENSRIEIIYSAGRCNYTNAIRWNVTEWKVIEITIHPKGKFKPQDIGFNLSKYKVEWIPDVKSGRIYTNFDKGIELVIFMGDIELIEYFPSKKFQKFSCDKK